jgi:hypothetical protein
VWKIRHQQWVPTLSHSSQKTWKYRFAYIFRASLLNEKRKGGNPHG